MLSLDKIYPRIALLFGLPRLVELRWLGARRMSLFTDKLAVIENALGDSQVAGLDSYLIINSLRPDTVERRKAPRDYIFTPLRGQCSADEDTLCRDPLPFDVDTVKPTGTASTPEQRELALQLAQRLVAYLVAAGFPDPVAWVDSGNGIHIYFRAASFPNTRETDLLLTSLYTCLARKFDTPECKLDKSVRSPAQLMRLPGSYNHKAQRTCEILSFNATAGAVTLDQVRAVVTDLRGSLGFKKELVLRQGTWTAERMERFLEFHGIDYLPGVEIASGVLFICNPCPLSPDHCGSSPALLVTRSGYPKFICLHESCGGGKMPWRKFCTKLYRETGKWFLTKEKV